MAKRNTKKSEQTPTAAAAPESPLLGLSILSLLVWIAGVVVVVSLGSAHVHGALMAIVGVLFFIAGLSPRIMQQWERAIVLRLGRYTGTRGPGLFFIVPLMDRVARVVDQRVITTSFNAEQTLTRDTVPVNVDAVLFWHVHDPERAALEVQNYKDAVSWAAQTALRDLIGRTSLADMLVGRETMEKTLQDMIDHRIGQWGVTVQAVEMRDVIIPAALQEAMSKEAQAEREKNARVILGEAEVLIAKQFEEAGRTYNGNAVALHLRALNVLYEGLKQNAALMVVPSNAVESMGGMGSLAGLGAMMKQQMATDGVEAASKRSN